MKTETELKREKHREYCRNAYRRKAGIPMLAPKWSTTTGRPPLGTVKRQISLTPAQWKVLDSLRGRVPRGRFIVKTLNLGPAVESAAASGAPKPSLTPANIVSRDLQG